MTSDQRGTTPDERRRRTTVPGAVAALAALLLVGSLTAGCGRSPEELTALKAEPMSSAIFDGLRLVSEDQRDAEDSGDTITGKPVDAKITRVFEADDPSTLPRHFTEVVDRATKDGWTEKFSFATSFTGQKRVDSRTGQLDVVLAPCEAETCLYLYLTLL